MPDSISRVCSRLIPPQSAGYTARRPFPHPFDALLVGNHGLSFQRPSAKGNGLR